MKKTKSKSVQKREKVQKVVKKKTKDLEQTRQKFINGLNYGSSFAIESHVAKISDTDKRRQKESFSLEAHFSLKGMGLSEIGGLHLHFSEYTGWYKENRPLMEKGIKEFASAMTALRDELTLFIDKFNEATDIFLEDASSLPDKPEDSLTDKLKEIEDPLLTIDFADIK